MIIQTKCKLNNAELSLFLKLHSERRNWNISSKSATAANNVQRITILPQINNNILPLQSACISGFFFVITSFSLQTYFSTTLILVGAKNYTWRLINLRKQLEFTRQAFDSEETSMKLKLKSQSSLQTLLLKPSFIQFKRHCLLTCKIKQKTHRSLCRILRQRGRA